MLFVLRGVPIDVFKHLCSQIFGHFCHTLSCKVAVGVDIEGLTLDPAEGPRDLHIETELEANLGLARASQATHFDYFSEAEDYIKEVLL